MRRCLLPGRHQTGLRYGLWPKGGSFCGGFSTNLARNTPPLGVERPKRKRTAAGGVRGRMIGRGRGGTARQVDEVDEAGEAIEVKTDGDNIIALN